MTNFCCVICKYNKSEILSKKVRDSNKHKIVKCKKCSHIQLFPIPLISDDKLFYDRDLQAKNIKNFGSISEMRKKSIVDTVRRYNFVKKLVTKNSKILEIGSGYGFFLESMSKSNFDITGIEISKNRRKISKSVSKTKILDINILEKTPSIPKMNLITMFHVLEHISDPIEYLKKIKPLLKSSGKILIEVPNVDDFQLFQNDAYTEFYWQRAHIQYFNPKTLRRVMKRAGFDVTIKGIQRYSLENMMNWRILKKPQLEIPTYALPPPYDWLDDYYKTKLEKSLRSDTIIALGTIKK